MKNQIDSIIELTQTLINIPSQGGINSCSPILHTLRDWLINKGLNSQILTNQKQEELGVLIAISGKGSKSTYCLNACIDTAPFGDLSAWQVSPTSGEIMNGWLYGRGSADSKIAVSIFSHIALFLNSRQKELEGNLHFLFDADEHTGNFGGIKAYLDTHKDVSGFMIGYPGNLGVNIGARGFYRVKLTVYGTSEHSGTSKVNSENAIQKAAYLVQKLADFQLPQKRDSSFQLKPKLTITGINGGHSYSIIPDICNIYIDIRLTLNFVKTDAEDIIKTLVQSIDKEFPTRQRTEIYEEGSCSAYLLPEDSKVGAAIIRAASKIYDKNIPPRVCGPSNIGNYLASRGIEATCGYGVNYKNVHAPNERIDISTIETTFNTYLEAISILQSQS